MDVTSSFHQLPIELHAKCALREGDHHQPAIYKGRRICEDPRRFRKANNGNFKFNNRERLINANRPKRSINSINKLYNY